MGILILLSIAIVAIFACYWLTVGAFRLLIRLLDLPKYQDVVVPSKYDFKTVVEFNNPLTQYVYDLMAGFKHATEDSGIKLGWSFVFFVALGAMASFVWVLIIAVITLWFLLWASPSAMRAARWRAKTFKDCTAEDWHKTHLWTMKSELRQQEMASAIRRSGVGGLHR
ncbi:hypothetical protein [Candidatus Nitrotoga sp. 1052]|uniref:hypothetical protein n=1 Tax=Candidatus Nitrotoga sp. 1052 TaxID=2886964 RepID=UPI001EF70391|nr:hypothetical protein [Candidatus Nitrotoga sp. 1052]CAH1073386.1 conserved hypothetical protein [Candidatus Nitrotoga sp. 1052]